MIIPRSIQGLSLLTAIVSGLVIVALSVAAVFISHEEIEAQIDHRIELEMQALLDYHALNGTRALIGIIRKRDGETTNGTGYLAQAGSDGRMMVYALSDARGDRLAGSLIPQIPGTGWREFLSIRRPDGSKGQAQALSRPLPGGGQLVVAGDRDALKRADDRILMVAFVALAVVLLVGTVSTIALGRIIRQRLVLISGTAQGIIEGDYARRIPVDGSGSEFDRISAILNAMLSRIESLMLSLRQVSSDIAHDMRTPLGRIRQDMEALMLTAQDSATQDTVERTIADMDALLDLFSGLLGISEVQGQAARRRFVQVDLMEIAGDVVEAYRPAFDDEGRSLLFEASGPLLLTGDAQLLKRVVANLLENVLVHAGNGVGAALRLWSEGGRAMLSVTDEGRGVPVEERSRIFERLVRLDPARSKSGHGLGLSMVRAIISAHQGTIEIAPADNGLTLLVTLPLRP